MKNLLVKDTPRPGKGLRPLHSCSLKVICLRLGNVSSIWIMVWNSFSFSDTMG